MAHRILVTGAAGYIGAMLCDRLSEHDDVEAIIGLDLKPIPELLRGNPKVTWVIGNTAEPGWRDSVAAERPDVVINAAWIIRETYGQANSLNVAGSDAVFDFVFAAPSVRKLLHFSTVAGYGPRAENTIAQRFTEDAPFVQTDFTYGEEKRLAERHLEEKFARSDKAKQVVVLRPAAVTGPRGRSRSSLFGLQSALNGSLKGSLVARLVGLVMNIIPVTPEWCRQFVHEDDLAAVVALLAMRTLAAAYSKFNISPPGEPMTAADMAAAFRKRLLPMHPYLVRFAFFLAWHATRGRIPTGRGVWRSYSYPVVVDGSALTKTYGYRYRYGTKDAFTKNEGHYATASAAPSASSEMPNLNGMKTAL
jgi:nucleoside-diphosphate-sugar epimerase